MRLLLLMIVATSGCALLKRKPVPTDFCEIKQPPHSDQPDLKDPVFVCSKIQDGKRTTYTMPFSSFNEFTHHVIIPNESFEAFLDQ